MPRRNEQRKRGTTRGSPRRSRTAKAARISRKAAKSRCVREWGGWGRLSEDGPGQHNPVRSEGPWGRARNPPERRCSTGRRAAAQNADHTFAAGSTKDECKPHIARVGREQASPEWCTGRPRPKGRPWSRTGENPPYGILGGTMETSASFEARYAPSSYPTAQLREDPGGEVHGAAADDAHEAAGEARGGQNRASATPARPHPGARRLLGLGREGSRPILRRAHERPGTERLSVRCRVDLVARVAAAQSMPPHHGAPTAKPGRPMAAHPAHLPSLSVRAPGRHHPRWEPDAVIPHVRICAGGAGRPASLPRQDWGGLQSTAEHSRAQRIDHKATSFQRVLTKSRAPSAS